jgi:hypothetical protein
MFGNAIIEANNLLGDTTGFIGIMVGDMPTDIPAGYPASMNVYTRRILICNNIIDKINTSIGQGTGIVVNARPDWDGKVRLIGNEIQNVNVGIQCLCKTTTIVNNMIYNIATPAFVIIQSNPITDIKEKNYHNNVAV